MSIGDPPFETQTKAACVRPVFMSSAGADPGSEGTRTATAPQLTLAGLNDHPSTNRMTLRAILFCLLCSVQAFADLAAGRRAYEKGDYATALNEYLPLAKQGNIEAQFTVGGIFKFGLGVPRDYTEAVKWFRLAADQGDAGAQYQLAVM